MDVQFGLVYKKKQKLETKDGNKNAAQQQSQQKFLKKTTKKMFKLILQKNK